MIGYVVGMVVGCCSSAVTGEVVRNCVNFNTLTKAQRILVQVGAGGIGMVVGTKVAAEVESTINEFTDSPNILSD